MTGALDPTETLEVSTGYVLEVSPGFVLAVHIGPQAPVEVFDTTGAWSRALNSDTIQFAFYYPAEGMIRVVYFDGSQKAISPVPANVMSTVRDEWILANAQYFPDLS